VLSRRCRWSHCPTTTTALGLSAQKSFYLCESVREKCYRSQSKANIQSTIKARSGTLLLQILVQMCVFLRSSKNWRSP